MQFQVSRDGQLYGPYTLEDLQRYVASGNVLLTDLAKSEDMPDWLPVSQILGTSAAPAPIYAAAAPFPPSAYVAQPTGIPYPDPPNVHWILLLLFSFLTCGIFMIVYDLIQALWVKKVKPDTKVLTYYLIFLGIEVVNIALTTGKMSILMRGMREGVVRQPIGLTLVSLLVSLALLVVLIIYRFTMRADLEQHFNTAEPLGLRLGPVMTFFFGGLYFQYHFNRINEIKTAMRYRTPGM